MPLTLNVISSGNNTAHQILEHEFNECGGTIGRSMSNSWILPDENRHLSASHATIEYKQGKYFIIDTSTNGVFVNGAGKPLGRGEQQQLEDGFQLMMGTFSISVDIKDKVSIVPTEVKSNNEDLFSDLVDDSKEDLDPFPLEDITFNDKNSSSSVKAGSDDPFFEFDDFSTKDDSSVDIGQFKDNSEENSTSDFDDFFKPAGIKQKEEVIDSFDFLEDKKIEKSTPEHVQENLAKETDASVISEVWWESTTDIDPFDDLLSGIGEPTSEEIEPEQSDERGRGIPEKERGSLEIDHFMSSEREGGVKENGDNDKVDEFEIIKESASFDLEKHEETELRQPPSQRHVLPNKQEVPVEKESGLNEENDKPVKEQERIESPKNTGLGGSDSMSHFLKGVGVDEEFLGIDLTEEHLFLAGKLFRSALQGTMEVLRSRTEIKNEMRMDMTMIQPIQNNPIKFAINTDEAFKKLFLINNKSYMDPELAMKEAYDDIKSHQMAVISGIQASLVYVLKRFEPENLIKRLEKESPISASIPIHRKSKLWDKFEELYEAIESEAEDDFNRLFGQKFAEAYDEQIALLKKERGNK